MITKKHAWYFILTVVIIALIVVFFRIKNTTGEQEQVLNEVLKFSNTQEWDTELYGIIDDEPLILKNSFEKIKLPTPPSNDSKETEEELMVLHSMVSERTGEKVEQIKREVEIMTTPVGKYEYSYLVDPKSHPYTKYLIESILDEYNPVVMSFKNHFDRVRPSHLDPSLSTAIEIPGHPAYPSGHSSQTHLFAHVMSDLDPKNRDDYFESAREVARNREVAGLHYPSDSEAGRLLAEQFYALLKETVWYKTMLDNAKTEWEY